jgi:hypothetical protein
MQCFCRCGYEFCYTCGAEWKNKKATCSCPIWDERNIIRRWWLGVWWHLVQIDWDHDESIFVSLPLVLVLLLEKEQQNILHLLMLQRSKCVCLKRIVGDIRPRFLCWMLALITLQIDWDGYQSISVSLSISSTFFGLLKKQTARGLFLLIQKLS